MNYHSVTYMEKHFFYDKKSLQEIFTNSESVRTELPTVVKLSQYLNLIY